MSLDNQIHMGNYPRLFFFFPMFCFYMVLDLHWIISICQFLIIKLKFEVFCIKLTLMKTCEDPHKKKCPKLFQCN
jgi:hypothetical protein